MSSNHSSKMSQQPTITEDFIVKSGMPSFEYPQISMAEYLAPNIAQHDPTSIAFIDPATGEELTYGQFHQKCQEYASALVKLGITKQDLVLFYADSSVQYAIALIGTIYLGLSYIPVPPAHGPYELSEQIKGVGATVLVFGSNKLPTLEKVLNNSDYAKSFENLKLIVEYGDAETADSVLLENRLTQNIIHTFKQIISLGSGGLLPRIPHFPVDNPESDPFLICYTSGTTGPPKGALLSHRSFVATLINLKLPQKYRGQRNGISFPLGHMSGSIFMPQALVAGMTVILFASPDIDLIMSYIAKYRINHYIFGANAITPLAHKNYPELYDLSCLKVLRYGGSKFPEKLLRGIQHKYQSFMFEIYGATEFMGHVTTVNNPEIAFGEHFEPGNLGPPQSNIELKIVDLKSGEALKPNQTGEICFRGSPMFVGYLNNADATRSTIDEQCWYHTGDVGHYNQKGFLFVTDRIKELIKYKQWSVIPAEIEDFLHRHEAVWSCCVVGVQHVTDEFLIRAYVQVAPESSVSETELIEYVQENMGFQKRLRGGVVFIAEMPRTAVGKIDRQYFKRLVKDELITEEIP